MQSSCTRFGMKPIHLGFAFNEFKSQNGSTFMNRTNFDNQPQSVYMTFIKL
jgi:hypothetical protein